MSRSQARSFQDSKINVNENMTHYQVVKKDVINWDKTQIQDLSD